MALAIVYSRASIGIEAPLVTVEADVGDGMPAFNIVGLPETAVKESKERVRGAILNSCLTFPGDHHITVNLAPADLPKSGGRFDLAIAVGILAASGQLDAESLKGREFFGELALSGAIRQVPGLLPGIMACVQAERRCVAPRANVREAGLIRTGRVDLAAHLLDVLGCLKGEKQLPAALYSVPPPAGAAPDLQEVKGQHQARRALTIAAAGGHNLLFRGPPGTGKSMLASRIPGILPPLTDAQALESAAIRSIAGLDIGEGHWCLPPFRSPHHTSSAVALVGGGSSLHAGEISLAHHGVLFLDELPQFSPHVLEVMREPMERGAIMISRARYQVTLPASFQLVAAMNPCPCGYHGDPLRQCQCPPDRVEKYRQRISGPLLDRIDLHVDVPRPPPGDMGALLEGEDDPAHGSAAIRARVSACRHLQYRRAGKTNAGLGPAQLREHCPLSKADARLLENAVTRLKLSSRAYHRIIRIARTIADLAEQPIGRGHLLEAINFRTLDRG